MVSKHRNYRMLAGLLALIMVFSLIPASVVAAEGTTVAGPAETVDVNAGTIYRENDFNKGWKFYLGDNSSAQNQNFDDSSWDDISLPHDFSITQHFTASGEAESGFLPGGTGWYRKAFVMPEDAAGKTILLNFDGAYKDTYVYVNGTFVGEHHYGYTNFAIDITEHLVCDGASENVISVKVENQLPSSRWYSGSGIYRDVTMIVTDPVHVDLNGTYVTTPNIASGNGTVNVKVDVVNDGTASAAVTVKNTVYAKGTDNALASAESTVTVAAGATATATNAPVVSAPKLWSNEAPNLYTVVTELTAGGKVVDTYETEFGFRWFSFNTQSFQVNGKNVKLDGVCLHHDQGGLGAAAYYDAMYRQLSIMKDMGCNAIRTSHNPADEQFIEICNELGLLVIEETFDGLVDPKNYNSNDFSTHFEQAVDSNLVGAGSGMTCAEYATRSIVKRDRNAASVFAWSFGNEIQEGTDWANVGRYDDICANYISWVNAVDGSRVVTSGDNNRGGDQRLVDVINTITSAGGFAGFNYANAISGGSDRDLSYLAQEFGGQYSCVIASETSSATNSRGQYKNKNNNSDSDGEYHLTSYDTSSVSWGITAHDSIYNTYQLDNVAGEFVWTGFDYIGEPTPWNGTGTGDSGRGAIPNSSYFGIVETTGFPKDSYYLYRSQWHDSATTLHLVTAWDADNQMLSGGMTPVWVYSNAPVVKLFREVNGNSVHIGTATRQDHTSAAGHTYYTYNTQSDNTSLCTTSTGSGADGLYAIFNVAYEAGRIYAEAYDANGTKIALNEGSGTNSVSTPGTASRLVVTQNKTTAEADGSSLVYVTVDVTDANGNPDTTATNNITFTLSGPGEIAAVDNGDQATVRKYQNSYVKDSDTTANINAYAGKALVIVRSTEDAGTITLNVAAEGLTGQTVTINTTADTSAVTEGLVSYTMVRDYTVKAGTVPALNTSASGTMSDGTTVSGTVTWDEIPESDYGVVGDYTVNGTLTLEGQEPMPVSAKLHVIPNIIDLRNVSTATIVNTQPTTLPDTVRGVLANGELAGEFPVTWNAPEASVYDTVGEIVTVTGTAVIFGDETMDVTCTVRVAEAVNSESTNVAPMADSLTQDIASNMQSDTLNSINDGVTSPSDSESTRWTNWKNRYNSATATITLTWATAQTLSDINLYYRLDSACKHPASVEISYSLNGVDFITVGATETQITGVSVNYGEAYHYALDQVINPVALKVTFTQQGGTSEGKCVGLYEIECMTYAASFTTNTSANLSGINVSGTPIDGFSADTLAYEVDAGAVTADTAVNAGITVLPAYEGVVRILTVSEDGSAAKTYEVTLIGAVCSHSNTTRKNASAATCTTDGYTGDVYCNDCKETIQIGTVIAATGHQHKEIRDAAPATCTTAGYTGDTWCTDCNTKIETGTKIDASHSWDDGVITKEPTESEVGIKTYTCTVCKDTKTEDILNIPSVSLEVTANASGRIVMKATMDNYANREIYHEITSHGIVFIRTSRIGNRLITVNTSGRTRVNFSDYSGEGSFTYNMEPVTLDTFYAVRAFLIYTDPETGDPVVVYSDMLRGSHNTFGQG